MLSYFAVIQRQTIHCATCSHSPPQSMNFDCTIFVFYVPETRKNKHICILKALYDDASFYLSPSLVHSRAFLERENLRLFAFNSFESPSCMTDRSYGGSKAAELFNCARAN